MSKSWSGFWPERGSRPMPANSSATDRPASCTTSTSITPTLIESRQESSKMSVDPRALRPSATFPPHVLAEIHRAADQGLYEIRGFGAKRRLPTFEDLVFLGASVSRYPLEGYREKCATDVWLGTRFAKKPIHLKIPITIAGMSFGALGANAKEAIGRACTEIGTSSTTGDGGMTEEER